MWVCERPMAFSKNCGVRQSEFVENRITERLALSGDPKKSSARRSPHTTNRADSNVRECRADPVVD